MKITDVKPISTRSAAPESAFNNRDLPLVETTVFVLALLIIVTNFLVDIAYTYLNPRIRFQ